ncbi:hypothetical protein WDU94_014009 [Cyamophila willieti]
MPIETRRLFECEHLDQMPKLKDLMVFMKKRLTILEMSPEVRKPPLAMPRAFIATEAKAEPRPQFSPQNTCPYCKNMHRIHQCPDFIAMNPHQRHDVITNAKLCLACLGPHMRSQCKSTYSCRTCHDRSHHSLLHMSASPKGENSSSKQPAHSSPASTTVLLGTAAAQVQCSSGYWHTIRLILDPGSMTNFISSSLAQTLNLPLLPTQNLVTGLGHTPVQTSRKCTNLKLCPVNSSHLPMLTINATVIPTISSEIPVKPVPIHIADRFQNLADYSIFHKTSKVDILLGAAHLADILLPGQPIIPGQPSCWPTVFGNVLLGEIPNSEPLQSQQSLFVNSQDDFLCNQLKQFWETEEIPAKKFASPEDLYCEKHFEETHTRNKSGQFIVRLPFKTSPSLIGSTRDTALKQFHSLERKLDKNERLKGMYHANIQDYVNKEQIEVAATPSAIVLPHHAILKESSSSPLRVVFNASQPSTSNQTLNNTMFIGPKLQHDVGDILLLFRMNAVAICGDIRQMYRAVLIHPEDRRYQHIFWRFSQDEPVQEWELKRLTFGFAPASYLAQKCLRTLAVTEKDKYPAACQALFDSCYVDDIVTGAATPQEALELCEELVALLSSGGFELKKFASSSPEVLAHIPPEDQEQSLVLHDTSTIKVLGLRWDPKVDCFRYTITIKPQVTVTKRTLLSHVASIFDINGYLTHLVIFLKILLQKIWITKGDWDDPLPSHLLSEWNDFVHELPCLADLMIPRYISSAEAVQYQLIGFSDASSAAMSAVIYLHTTCSNGSILINLLRAKSKVAPLKTMSIPRLELSAAFLLVKLIKSLDHFIKSLKIESITCFSDSTTTLAWIQTPPYLLKTYAANRVAAIVETIDPSHWRYVPTSLNPADLATRGLLPTQVMSQYEFWFHGPEFLHDDRSTWPASPTLPATDKLPELKPNVVLISQDKPVPAMISLIEKYSSLTKLQHVVAWMFRFISNCRKKEEDRFHDFLSPAELDSAMSACVLATQQYYFAEVMSDLRHDKPILGPLKNLSPFLSSSGSLMVGGRLKNAPLTLSSKHPKLLPAKCHLSKLIVDYLHLYSLHGGARIIQSLLQRQYWIVGARNLIKQRVFACLKCYKLSVTVSPPYMGDLPISRFAQGRCFINTAIDFAGPYLLKTGPRRNSPITKSYMVVFVCMATKAVHLELANSLNLESCLAALDRFIARRGKPSHMYSDQGSNFKASARHLTEVQQYLKIANPHLNQQLSSRGIFWHFNPAGAPNFSGLAEAGVKSAKHHLSRLLNGRPLYQEEITTLLCEVEACLNSRPLGFLSTVPDDRFDYLTPGHFLVGAPLLARPEYDVSDETFTSLCRWKLLTKINQTLWRRWSTEYLHSQIQRLKWHKKTPNLKVGDPVFIVGENVPPRDWLLSRVVKVTHGADGIVRVAQVQGRHGLLTRPASKLCPLPVLH